VKQLYATALIATLLSTTSCSEETKGPRSPNNDEVPEVVSVAGGPYTSGLAMGSLRVERDVKVFRITKHPISVRQYSQCIAVGACSEPSFKGSSCTRRFVPGRGARTGASIEGMTYGVQDDLPVTCTTVEQAKAYCSWQRGGLPSTDQWLKAARGTSPLQHSWGNHGATCEHHPGAIRPERCPMTLSSFAIGTHPKSASVSGLEDVLLTRGELTAGEPGSHLGSCSTGPCVGFGFTDAASIDAFQPVSTDAEDDRWLVTYGFRCVLSEVSR